MAAGCPRAWSPNGPTRWASAWCAAWSSRSKGRWRSRPGMAPNSASSFHVTGGRMAEVRILVVEDETIVAMDIADALRRLGYIVSAVLDNGPAAIEAAASSEPDLILMDIRLKGAMDGVDAARVIRERFEIPILFLTAHGDANTVERA